MYYREKDQQLAKLNELQRLQSQQAEHALEDFKSQVERNSSKMFDDMKKQVPVFSEVGHSNQSLAGQSFWHPVPDPVIP